MPSHPLPFRHDRISRARAALGLLLAMAPSLGGCKLVDRTTFGAVPVKPPTQALTAALESEGRIPLLTIRYDGADRSYADALRLAVQQTEMAHPGILYIITTAVPASGDLSQQISQAKTAQTEARTVADEMVLSGVDADRISFASATDPAISQRETRIFIRHAPS